MTKPQAETPAFEKEVVRLPDGRELTYYRFPEESKETKPSSRAGAAPRPPQKKEP